MKWTYRFSLFLAAGLTAAAPAALADGKVPLEQEAHINAQLTAAAAGDMLRNTCPTLSARVFVVWSKLTQLENYARAQGYAEAEVKVFLKDKAQKARIKAAAQAYLAKAGAVEGDVESFCSAGRAEIEQSTLVGSLLKSSN